MNDVLLCWRMNGVLKTGDHAGAEEPLQGEDVQPRRKAHSGRHPLLHGEPRRCLPYVKENP